jgi:hypothetical protein
MFVYVIVNCDNFKIYVGKTINSDLKAYLRRKIWSAQTGRYNGRSHLFHAMQKHSSTVWSIHSLFEGRTNKELCGHETLLIKALNSRHPDIGYNICAGGEGNRSTPNLETRAKLREASKQMWQRPGMRERFLKNKAEEITKMVATRRKHNNLGWGQSSETIAKRVATRRKRDNYGTSMLGKSHTSETIKKMREAALKRIGGGMLGKHHSPEIIQRIAVSNRHPKRKRAIS